MNDHAGHQTGSEAGPNGRKRRAGGLGGALKSLPLLATVVLCTSVASTDIDAGELTRLEPPRPAPELSLPDISGRTQALADYRDRVLLVNFWASWCPPCIYEMPGLQRLAKQFEDRPFALLAVNVGEAKHRVRRFLKLTRFTETVLLDKRGEAFARWGASVYPTTYLIDRAGLIRFEAIGPLEWDSDAILATVEQLLAESPDPSPKVVEDDASLAVSETPQTRAQ